MLISDKASLRRRMHETLVDEQSLALGDEVIFKLSPTYFVNMSKWKSILITDYRKRVARIGRDERCQIIGRGEFHAAKSN